MSPEFVISFATDSLLVAVKMSAPILVTALVLGLIVSIFQAVTQIQEMTLAIIPKIGGVIAVIIILMPWLLSTAVEYMEKVFSNIPFYIGMGG